MCLLFECDVNVPSNENWILKISASQSVYFLCSVDSSDEKKEKERTSSSNLIEMTHRKRVDLSRKLTLSSSSVVSSRISEEGKRLKRTRKSPLPTSQSTKWTHEVLRCVWVGRRRKKREVEQVFLLHPSTFIFMSISSSFLYISSFPLLPFDSIPFHNHRLFLSHPVF